MRSLLFFLIIPLLFLTLSCQKKEETNGVRIVIVATTYPVYILTKNITQGVPGVSVDLLIPGELGCPHDFMLAPADMQRLNGADLIVLNGLGMESFLTPILGQLKKETEVVELYTDSMNLILIKNESGSEHEEHTAEEHADKEHVDADEHTGSAHEHIAASPYNPHLFASPVMQTQMAQLLGNALSKTDALYSQMYKKNVITYANTMDTIQREFTELIQQFELKRVLSQGELFGYLMRDMGVEVVASIDIHENSTPAAADLIELISTAKEKNAQLIFVDSRFPEELLSTLVSETTLPFVRWDAVNYGSITDSAAIYSSRMRSNGAALKTALEASEVQ